MSQSSFGNKHHINGLGSAQNLARRNVLIMNVCLILIVFGSAIWGLKSIKSNTSIEVQSTLQSLLNSTVEGFEIWHRQHIMTLDTVARHPEFQRATVEQLEAYQQGRDLKSSDALNTLRKIIPVFSGLTHVRGFFVIAPDGTSIASMRDENLGTPNLIKEQRPDLFERALQGETLLVPPIQSDVPLEGESNIAGRAVPPTMFFLAPIRMEKTGQVIALVAARESPAGNFSDVAKFGRIGKSGESYLFDRQGRMLTQSRFLEDLQKIGVIEAGDTSILSVLMRDPGQNLLLTRSVPDDLSSYPLTHMAKRAIAGEKATNIEGYRDYRGVKVVGAWAWIDSMDLGFTTELDYDEAMLPYRFAQNTLVVILAAVLVASMTFSVIALKAGTRTLNVLESAKGSLEKQVKDRTRQLAKSQEQLQLVVDNVPAVVFLKDPHGKYLMINKKYTDLTGITPEQALGKNDFDIFPEDVARAFSKADSAVLESGHAQDIEEKAPDPDGAMHDYWSSKIPLSDEKGNITALLCTSLDITERKNSERLLSETKDFIAQSEARWRAILDNLGDAVITLDKSGNIQTFSKTASEIFGYTSEEVAGNSINKLIPPDTVKDQDAFLSEPVDTGVSVLLNEQRDLMALRKSGELFPIEITVTSVPFQEEKIYVGVMRDVTKSRKLRNELLKAKDVAEEASKAKSEFLAAMSHEIRTPMNGVLGMLSLLTKTELSKEQSQKVEIAQSSAQSLLSIINDILDFSKVEAGKLELENVDFNLRSQIESVCQSLAHKVHEKGLEFNLDLTEIRHSFVSGDPSRLRQILINLIGNAVKFTEQGEILVKARLEEEPLEDEQKGPNDGSYCLHCTVSDTGIGIPKEKVGNLFSSFTQVDSSVTRKYGGTGLGLAICKKITKLMGGRISVASKVGEGSEFSFSIRLRKTHISDLIEPAADVNGLRVLVLDDNKTNRDIFSGQLQEWGVQIEEAESADQAIGMCKQKADDDLYDMVLCDMAMPEKNGLDFAKEIRSDARYSNMKLLMMSSINIDADVLTTLGFSAYFSKPVTTSDLFDALVICANGDSKNKAGLLTKNKLKAIESIDREEIVEHVWPRNVRILLVEDNQVNQYVVQEMLLELGLSCDVAGNGLEAIESLYLAEQSDPYTIVLMDCQMPELDGYETTRRIREGKASQRLHDIPIVAMTANAMQGDKEKCFAAGMNAYVSKPIDGAELFSILKTWIGGEERIVKDQVDQNSQLASEPIESNDQAKSTADNLNGVSGEQKVSVVNDVVTEEGLMLPGELATIDFAMKKPSIARKPTAYLKLLKMYVDNNSSFCKGLTDAQSQSDEQRVHHLVHSIKGSAGNMGMMAVYNNAVRIEVALSKKSTNIGDELESFKRMVEASFSDARAIIAANS